MAVVVDGAVRHRGQHGSDHTMVSEKWTIDRRTMMSLIGAAFAAASLEACSSDSPAASATTTDASTKSGPATTSGAATTGEATTTTASGMTTEPSTTIVATTTSSAPRPTLSLSYPVPIGSARLQDLADQYAGRWMGVWAEETGGSGTLESTIGIDPATRICTGTFSFTGPFLQAGAGAPEFVSVTIDDGGTPETITATSNLMGDVAYTYQGGTTASAVAAMLPGNADAFSADFFLSGPTLSVSYSVTPPAGMPVFGACRVTRGLTPAPINPSTIRASRLQANLVSGRYAADLITSHEIAAALGEPVGPVEPNGGNLRYSQTIASTNCRCLAVARDVVVQISVFRAVDVASAEQLWAQYLPASNEHVTGLGNDALYVLSGLNLFIGKFVATISVGAYSNAPIAVDVRAAELSIAQAMVPRLLTAP